MKVIRCLKGSKGKCILISAEGNLDVLVAWTDSGYAGSDTKSQSGMIIMLGGSIIVWTSPRKLSTLSTAEAEPDSATLGWQIVEGLRYLLWILE